MLALIYSPTIYSAVPSISAVIRGIGGNVKALINLIFSSKFLFYFSL